MLLLEARGLSKRYGEGAAAVWALRDVSFGIDQGELVAIMGPSGSGKSTLMNLVGLLDLPSAGTLTLAGEATGRLSPDRLARLRNAEIGFVFQSYNLLGRTSALHNVELPLVYAGVRRRERLRRAEEALAAVGLAHRLKHLPTQLSGGEQQRVAIARALVCNPSIILADEPTGALDSRTGNEILDLFRGLNRQGRTIVLVTHDERIARSAARILRLQDGRLVGDTVVAERRWGRRPRARPQVSFPLLQPAGAQP
jgi:putative ABC transport system ATP-binding protein